MRTVAQASTLLGCLSLVACSGDDAKPTTITISAAKAPALVAFRDGLDGAWQAATMKTPTTYEAVVHGPYLATGVCEDLTVGDFTTYQVARTPDDDHELVLPCIAFETDEHPITGHMVQPGRLQLGGSIDVSSTADWNFALSAANGSYDLIAVTDDAIAIQRAITVSGALALATPIDVAVQGSALVPVAFTVTNTAAADTLTASIGIRTPTNVLSARVYRGPLAGARVAPDSVLVATDSQAVSILATAQNKSRTVRRPFRVGGNTALALPAAIGDVQFTLASDQLDARWTTLPEHDLVDLFVYAFSPDLSKAWFADLEISPQFEAATGVTHLALDTDIPGYQPAWRIDFTKEYVRELYTQRTIDRDLVSSAVSETVNPSAAPTSHVPIGLARRKNGDLAADRR